MGKNIFHELGKSIYTGEVEEFKKIVMDNQITFNQPTQENEWPLFNDAVKQKQAAIVSFIIERGLDVFDGTYKDYLGPIGHLVKNGLTDVIKNGIANNLINIKDANKHGLTLLHVAAKHNDNSFMDWLIENGAEVKAEDSERRTFDHFCAENDNFKMIYKYKDSIDLNHQDKSGKTILDHSVNLAKEEDTIKLTKLGARILLSTSDRVNKTLYRGVLASLPIPAFQKLVESIGPGVTIDDEDWYMAEDHENPLYKAILQPIWEAQQQAAKEAETAKVSQCISSDLMSETDSEDMMQPLPECFTAEAEESAFAQ